LEHAARFEAAQSEEGRYRMLVEAVTDYAIFMLDPQGIVSSWNPGARRFKGYEPFEIIGQHFSNFYTEEDKAARLPQRALEIVPAKGNLRTKVGASGRTAPDFGLTSLSILSATRTESSLDLPKLRAI
jgi:PAS domain-containing protein